MDGAYNVEQLMRIAQLFNSQPSENKESGMVDIPLGMPATSNPEQGQFANIEKPIDNTYLETLMSGGESKSAQELPATAGTYNGQPVPRAKDEVHNTKLMSKLIDLARDKSRNEQLNLQLQAQKMQDEATQRQKDYESRNTAHIWNMIGSGQQPSNLPMPQGAQGVPTALDQGMLNILGKDVNAPWDMAKAEMALQSQYQKQAVLQDKLSQKAKLDADKLRLQDVMQQRLLDFNQKRADADRASKEGLAGDKISWLREALGITQLAKDKANQDKLDQAQGKEYRTQVTKLMNGQETIADNAGKPVYLRDAVRDAVSGAGNRDVSEDSIVSGINQEKQEYFNLLNTYHQKDASELEELINNLQEARKIKGNSADASWWTNVAGYLKGKDPIVAKAIMLQGVMSINDRYIIDEILSGKRSGGFMDAVEGIAGKTLKKIYPSK